MDRKYLCISVEINYPYVKFEQFNYKSLEEFEMIKNVVPLIFVKLRNKF